VARKATILSISTLFAERDGCRPYTIASEPGSGDQHELRLCETQTSLSDSAGVAQLARQAKPGHDVDHWRRGIRAARLPTSASPPADTLAIDLPAVKFRVPESRPQFKTGRGPIGNHGGGVDRPASHRHFLIFPRRCEAKWRDLSNDPWSGGAAAPATIVRSPRASARLWPETMAAA